MKKADIGVALYILAAFIMLIVPISGTLLDVLLACNMAIAFTVLFSTMFAKEVLDLSFYPTVLLFTTIFRIALNVSSTRLILSTGNPGNVVTTFGNFVGGGDFVIGIVVFIILIIDHSCSPFFINLIHKIFLIKSNILPGEPTII